MNIKLAEEILNNSIIYASESYGIDSSKITFDLYKIYCEDADNGLGYKIYFMGNPLDSVVYTGNTSDIIKAKTRALSMLLSAVIADYGNTLSGGAPLFLHYNMFPTKFNYNLHEVYKKINPESAKLLTEYARNH